MIASVQLLSTISTGQPVDCGNKGVPSCALDTHSASQCRVCISVLFAFLVSRNLVNNKILHRSNLWVEGFWFFFVCFLVFFHSSFRKCSLSWWGRLGGGTRSCWWWWDTACSHIGNQETETGVFFPSFALGQVLQSTAWSCSHLWIGLFPPFSSVGEPSQDSYDFSITQKKKL